MLYDAFEYLYPPRPGGNQAIPPSQLGFYEARGWIAQYKKNGTNNVIFVSPERQIIFKNRHREDHARWMPNPAAEAAFKVLPGSGWYVFVGELLNDKVKSGPKNTNYIHDMLVCDGEYLVETTYEERQNRLFEVFNEFEDEAYSHYVINDRTWIAKSFTGGFVHLFETISAPEDEGIVVKNPKALLERCSRQRANQTWNRKCRKPTKNYAM